MKTKKKEKARRIPIPIGTEQETGLTRGETEKNIGPVKIGRKKVKQNKTEFGKGNKFLK